MMLIKRVIGFKSAQSGFSTIELMVALSLFAVVSVAAIQFVSQNEISLLEGRNDLTIQQKNAAIASGTTYNPTKKVTFSLGEPAFEINGKFHFYDLDYSLSAHKAGFKVGVSDVYITHASPGLQEFTKEFNKGQEWFLQKHKG